MTKSINSQYALSMKIKEAIDEKLVDHSEPTNHPNEKHNRKLLGENYIFDSPEDTKYASEPNKIFSGVMFAFTQQWVGIRQACGAFPVSKLAIDAYHNWTAQDIMDIVAEIESRNISTLVFHGMAPSTSRLIRGIKINCPSLKILSVWHGTMAGWAYEAELALFRELVVLLDRGTVDKVGFLRTGMNIVHKKSFKKCLFNIPPKSDHIQRALPAFNDKPIVCLFGSWNNQWKNMYTNVIGAESSDNVAKIICYQNFSRGLLSKTVHSPHGGLENHLTRTALVDLCLSVSINDCQPMTELEGLSVGTPSLRPNLDHSDKPQHEYERVFTVDRYLNPAEIGKHIDSLCKIDSGMIADLISSYNIHIKSISYDRYEEFLCAIL
ncbi:hypothetical protein [Methylobacterium brachiatum]|uniref:hypothetical protein n=1 Tax=Methylobacterium brachiatum TaxID=269660 RepID=UPI0033146F7C